MLQAVVSSKGTNDIAIACLRQHITVIDTNHVQYLNFKIGLQQSQQDVINCQRMQLFRFLFLQVSDTL